MTRIALVSSEPIRPRMAGIGIRYLELARRLPEHAPAGEIETVLVSPGDPADAAELDLDPARVRRFEAGRLGEILADADAVVAQGQLANDVVLGLPGTPVVIDLYDPWLVENLHYLDSLGLDPYRNDHATWVLQLSRGDFFLCSSEEQRTYYLGFLTALGRVNPHRVARDPDLRRLIAPVPFGIPDELPPHEPYLPPRDEGGPKRILFGGLYDWYDPDTLLDALELLTAEDPEMEWTLLLIENPNPDATPQELWRRVETRCRRRGWWGSRVETLPWVPAARRYDLLRDVDVLCAPHRVSLETRLSLRTRFLDALAAGCPVITSEGGALSRRLAEHDAGRVVAEGDAPGLARALRDALAEAGPRPGARALLDTFRWERVLEPLVAFCRDPRIDTTKEDFAFRPTTKAPADRLGFRVRRLLRRTLGRGSGGGA